MPIGFAGAANIAHQALVYLLSGAAVGTCYRTFESPTIAAQAWIGPTNPWETRPVGTHSAYYDANMDVPLDSLSPDLGLGYTPPYATGFQIHCLVHRGDAKTIWQQYGLNLEEDATYAIFDANEITPLWHDIVLLPNGFSYVVGDSILPITVLDTTIGYVAQVERRDPTDPSIKGY